MRSRFSKDRLHDPVTLHMRRDVARLRDSLTVGEALAQLRQQPPEGRIIYFYVVDADNRLRGVVPTRRLLLNPPERPVAEVMVRQVITLPAQATVLDACEFFIQHRLLAFPVVDAEGKLLGQVDVEVYTDEIISLRDASQRDELFQLIGVHLAEAQGSSATAAFRSRFPWLWCNIAGGILAAFLAGWFQDVLSRREAVLALFIPVVLALAESVGIQSVSLALQSLRGGLPTWSGLADKLRRELFTGLFLGGASGLAVGTTALLWLREWEVVGCLLLGISGGVAGAALLGLALPYLLRLLRRDPQVAAGPVVLALADMLTLLLYFSLGSWLL